MADTNATTTTDKQQPEELNDAWIRDKLIPKLIDDGKIFEKHQVQVLAVNVKPVSLDGFMLSAPSKVEIEFSYVDDGDKCEGGKSRHAVSDKLCLVVKKTPAVPKEVYVVCQFEFLFENELIAYTEIIPLLSQAKKYPKFYYSERKELSAVCVLEDFSLYGWRSAKQLYNLPLQHILMAVREVATFHGEMYALKVSNLRAFNKIAAQLKEARIANGNIHPEYNLKLVTCRERLVKAVKMYEKDKVPETFLEMFLEYTKNPYTMFKRQFEPIEPLAIICHGDYLRNNIAFKFDENDLPTDVMMYDFQTMRYASPMLDLTTLLIVSAFHDVRAKNFDEIFSLYHTTLLDAFCAKEKIQNRNEVPSYLSKDSLLKDYARHLPNSIIIAASFLPLLITPIEANSVFELRQLTTEEVIKDTMERGGALLDRELAHMMLEFYQLCNKFEIEFN
ncbi:uncharacterized protein LOC134826914 [Culicoides brevitarsis]|uniref:uncharacterized protein LOC134826914 n=1 Tax=Culicoides brevitarsis TaxID=469753 RepID=UPI00307B1B3F